MGRKAKKDTAQSDRRGHQRTHVLFSGSLVSGQHSARSVLLNVSATGANVRLAEDFDPSTSVTLRLARSIDLHVKVVWRQDDRVGLAFRDAPRVIGSILSGILPQEPATA